MNASRSMATRTNNVGDCRPSQGGCRDHCLRPQRDKPRLRMSGERPRHDGEHQPPQGYCLGHSTKFSPRLPPCKSPYAKRSSHRERAFFPPARKAKQAIRGWSMEPDAVQWKNKPLECRLILRRCSKALTLVFARMAGSWRPV